MATREQLKLNKAFGVALKRLRNERQLTQEDIAYGASISLTSVGRIEIGAQGVRLDTVMRLAAVLGISAAKLVAECERVLSKKKLNLD
jgi:transcriptional regulator with XRE-family HTH domain